MTIIGNFDELNNNFTTISFVVDLSFYLLMN